MKHLEMAWRQYAERVLPQDASPVQVLETRRAFYAGAALFLDRMSRLMSEGDEVTESDMQIVESIHAEIREFVADVAGGRK